MPPLEFQFFGSPRLVVDGLSVPARPRKVVVLLALLAARNAQPVERSLLIASLWPECDDQAGSVNLRRLLADLRALLGASATILSSPSKSAIMLTLDETSCDLVRFDRAAARWTKTRSLDDARWATSVYAGPLLTGWLDEPLLREREIREAQALDLLDMLASAALTDGRITEALTSAQRAESLDPLRETTQRLLVEALARSGDLLAARRSYQAYCGRLNDALGLSPSPETTALMERLQTISPSTTGVPKPIVVLPRSLASFLGRETELSQLGALLQRSTTRLVTITGTGGTGKTRLAIELARQQSDAFQGGVYFVDLSPLSRSATDDDLDTTLAAVLTIVSPSERTVSERILGALHAKPCLLVIDNAEHLVPTVSTWIERWLIALPEAVALMTSRIPLHLAGEQLFPLPPLTLPQTDELSALLASEASLLFVQRAQAVQPQLALTVETAKTVAALVRRLDGLPLALELAAARLRTLSLTELLERLSQTLDVLRTSTTSAPERQRTLSAALSWSVGLLSPQEQWALARLSVFAGGWFAEMASQLLGDDADTLLETLIDHSLVVVEFGPPGTPTRYRMLETVRAHAMALCESLGERDDAERALVAWAVALSWEAHTELWGPDGATWMARVALERENLRQARTVGSPADALAIVKGLNQPWWRAGAFEEALTATEEALFRAQALRDTTDYGWSAIGVEQLKQLLGRPNDQVSALESMIALSRRLGNTESVVICLVSLGTARRDRGEVSEGLVALTEAVRVARTLESEWLLPYALRSLGELGIRTDNDAATEDALAEALSLWHPTNHATHVAMTQLYLGELQLKQQRPTDATILLREALAIFIAQNVRDLEVRTRIRLATATGETVEAERALALAIEIGDRPGADEARMLLGTSNRL